MRRVLLLVLLALACGKKEAPPPPLIDAGPTVLEPMETPDPKLPISDAMVQADVELPPQPDRPEVPGGHIYQDKWDLPADAGLARCPNPPSGPAVTVRLEMIMNPKKTIDLVVPTLGIRRRLWRPHPSEPSSCHGAITENGNALRFFCSTDEGSVGGKVYARGSDVVLGVNSMSGKTQERFELPCGVRPRFENIACPSACDKESNSMFEKNECYCPDSAGVAPPSPVSTTQPRK